MPASADTNIFLLRMPLFNRPHLGLMALVAAPCAGLSCLQD